LTILVTYRPGVGNSDSLSLLVSRDSSCIAPATCLCSDAVSTHPSVKWCTATRIGNL